jgi:hypothetical protein
MSTIGTEITQCRERLLEALNDCEQKRAEHKKHPHTLRALLEETRACLSLSLLHRELIALLEKKINELEWAAIPVEKER